MFRLLRYYFFQDLKPGFILKNPEIVKKLKPQLCDEEPQIQSRSASEQPTISVPMPQQNAPIFQSINFCDVYS